MTPSNNTPSAEEMTKELYEYVVSVNVPESSMGTPSNPNINVYRYHNKEHELLDRSLAVITSLSNENQKLQKRVEELEEPSGGHWRIEAERLAKENIIMKEALETISQAEPMELADDLASFAEQALRSYHSKQ